MNVQDKINELVTEGTYTAYGLAKIVNQLREIGGMEPIRPQMMYNYLRNGLVVKGQKIHGETLRQVTNEEVRNFLVRYAERNGIKVTTTEPESAKISTATKIYNS